MRPSEYVYPGLFRQCRFERWMVLGIIFGGLLLSPSVVSAQTCNTATIVATTPTSDFSDNADGTVTHIKTGLMWKRCSEGQTWDGTTCTGWAAVYSWQAGLQQAKGLNDAGGFAAYTDWRVPNTKELNTLMEEQCVYPSINTAVFSSAQGFYWSSSPHSVDAAMAWGTYFYNAGFIEIIPKAWLGHLRLVRSN